MWGYKGDANDGAVRDQTFVRPPRSRRASPGGTITAVKRALSACILAVALLLEGGGFAASASDWEAVADGDLHAALANLDTRALVVRCDAGQLALGYSIRKEFLADEYKGATNAYLMVMFDKADGGLRTSFPTKFIERDADMYLAIMGKDAADIARKIGQAKAAVFVGLSLTEPTAETFDRPHPNKIPISGANAAIGATLVACGFKPGPAISAAAAEGGWLYDAETKTASVEQDGYRLVAHCDQGEVIVYYGVPDGELADEIVDLERAYIIFVVDQKANGTGAYDSVNSNFIVVDNLHTIGLGGPTAIELARKFGRAKSNVVAGISTTKPGGSYTKRNTTQFPVSGARDAITSMLTACGKKY